MSKKEFKQERKIERMVTSKLKFTLFTKMKDLEVIITKSCMQELKQYKISYKM